MADLSPLLLYISAGVILSCGALKKFVFHWNHLLLFWAWKYRPSWDLTGAQHSGCITLRHFYPVLNYFCDKRWHIRSLPNFMLLLPFNLKCTKTRRSLKFLNLLTFKQVFSLSVFSTQVNDLFFLLQFHNPFTMYLPVESWNPLQIIQIMPGLDISHSAFQP